jgi:hypothetical protein
MSNTRVFDLTEQQLNIIPVSRLVLHRRESLSFLAGSSADTPFFRRPASKICPKPTVITVGGAAVDVSISVHDLGKLRASVVGLVILDVRRAAAPLRTCDLRCPLPLASRSSR